MRSAPVLILLPQADRAFGLAAKSFYKEAEKAYKEFQLPIHLSIYLQLCFRESIYLSFFFQLGSGLGHCKKPEWVATVGDRNTAGGFHVGFPQCAALVFRLESCFGSVKLAVQAHGVELQVVSLSVLTWNQKYVE